METPPEERALVQQILTARAAELRATLQWLQTTLDRTPARDTERRAGLADEIGRTRARFREVQAQRGKGAGQAPPSGMD